MRGHAEMDDLSSSVTDHKPGVQESEPSGRNDQEIHRGDVVPVIAEKRPPSVALIMVRLSLREISRDGGQADGDSELSEFSADLSGAPTVLSCESTNEGLHLS